MVRSENKRTREPENQRTREPRTKNRGARELRTERYDAWIDSNAAAGSQFSVLSSSCRYSATWAPGEAAPGAAGCSDEPLQRPAAAVPTAVLKGRPVLAAGG